MRGHQKYKMMLCSICLCHYGGRFPHRVSLSASFFTTCFSKVGKAPFYPLPFQKVKWVRVAINQLTTIVGPHIWDPVVRNRRQFTRPKGHNFVSGSPSVVGGVRERFTHRSPLDVPCPNRGRGLFAQGGKGNFRNRIGIVWKSQEGTVRRKN